MSGLRQTFYNLRENRDTAINRRSCHKRPISTAQITAIVDDIETALYNREDREIPTMVIGELVMDHLKDLDPVAYVRFASVYREFKDIDTFMDEIKSLLSSN